MRLEGPAFLIAIRLLMLTIENESIRICEFIGVFQISSIVTDNRDDQTMKVFKKMWRISGKWKSSFVIIYRH